MPTGIYPGNSEGGIWRHRAVPKTYEVSAKRFKLPKHIGVRIPPNWKAIATRKVLDEMPYPPTFRSGDNLNAAAIDAFNRRGL